MKEKFVFKGGSPFFIIIMIPFYDSQVCNMYF